MFSILYFHAAFHFLDDPFKRNSFSFRNCLHISASFAPSLGQLLLVQAACSLPGSQLHRLQPSKRATEAVTAPHGGIASLHWTRVASALGLESPTRQKTSSSFIGISRRSEKSPLKGPFNDAHKSVQNLRTVCSMMLWLGMVTTVALT